MISSSRLAKTIDTEINREGKDSTQILLLWTASPVAQRVKCLPAVQETGVRSLGQEDPLEEGMATHSSILAWRTPWTEEPGVVHGVAESDTSEWLSTVLLPPPPTSYTHTIRSSTLLHICGGREIFILKWRCFGEGEDPQNWTFTQKRHKWPSYLERKCTYQKRLRHHSLAT